MADKEYVVQFLIRFATKVKAADEIQAEIEAFRKLSPSERHRVEKIRVCDSYSLPLNERNEPCQIDGSWETPDEDWLRSHLTYEG